MFTVVNCLTSSSDWLLRCPKIHVIPILLQSLSIRAGFYYQHSIITIAVIVVDVDDDDDDVVVIIVAVIITHIYRLAHSFNSS